MIRNLFDQYKHPENRLTHALVSCLDCDRRLLAGFLRWVLGRGVPIPKNLRMIEQSMPDEAEPSTENGSESLPDAWIHDGSSWALVIESKINAPLDRKQLRSHRGMAREYNECRLLALVAARPPRKIQGVEVKEWREVYEWMKSRHKSEWAGRMAEYMEVLEARLIEELYFQKGTLTMFSGIPFDRDRPYSYETAKRVLGLAMDELRGRRDLKKLGAASPKTRKAITGKHASSVWNFLLLEPALHFTKFPHLGLSIRVDELQAGMVVPNGMRGEYRRKLTEGDALVRAMEKVCRGIENRLKGVAGAVPWVEIVQRRFRHRGGSTAIVDAKLQFDPRTFLAHSRPSRKGVKRQPEWVQALQRAMANKGSNLQLFIGASFRYDRCPTTGRREILDHIASAWLACKPLLNLVRGPGHSKASAAGA